ncbi:MAG: hypothetical protein AB7F43_10965 [Bacteriovoracia bacterium]
MLNRIIPFISSLLLISNFAFSATPTMNADDIRQFMEDQNYDKEQTEAVIGSMKEQLKGAPIEISGALSTNGINGSFFVDTDDWSFDLTYKDPTTGRLVKKSNAVELTFYNGGIKFGLEYKWPFIFLPAGTSVQDLEGAVFGRGIGIELPLGVVGLDGAFMPGQNRPGTAFIFSPNIGLNINGLVFPKIEINKVNLE